MSENHTNCFSRGGTWGKKAPLAKGCPRCSKRKSWDVIAEVIRTFRDAVRRSGSPADVIAWDWGWGEDLSEQLIPLLPKDVKFMSVSEWDQPVDRGGVKTKVGEYSISVVGPGPRATKSWELARKHGLATMAKLQFNNTWEIAAVPYIPVLPLILQHCENLARAGISGIMASWTLGGYASPNLMAAKAYYFEPARSAEETLVAVATRRYGKAAAADMVESWQRFSVAFREFPSGVGKYSIPTHHGPANLLRLKRTGYRAGILLSSHDDITAWSGAYPAEVVRRQFAKMALLWKDGLTAFRQGLRKVSTAKRSHAETDLAIAETCYHHFQSVANQVEFYRLRGELENAAGAEKKTMLEEMRGIAEREIGIAKRQYAIARNQSMIAFESSNHYFYTPLDLVEKILNCRYIIDEIDESSPRTRL